MMRSLDRRRPDARRAGSTWRYRQPQDFEDTAVAGADAHLPKPCDPPDLLLLIARLLEATSDSSAAEAIGSDAEGV